MKDKLLDWLNKFLVANVFFVLLSFFWFVAAVVGKSAGVNLGLDAWYQLWEPVFTPAIGILMAGAIFSGLISWISKKLKERSLI